MEIRNMIRAWLSFTVLQLLGNLQQCMQPKIFSEILLRPKIALTDIKPIAASFFVHYWILLLLRLFPLCIYRLFYPVLHERKRNVIKLEDHGVIKI
ncbi:Adhesion G protein-coupled receptor [Dirofilaria immitis]